jgi:CHASE2 domain-containing sensor protein
MQYHDFDVWLNSHNPDLGGYPLRASCEQQGEFPDVCSIDPDSGPIQEMRSRLIREDTDKAVLTEFGALLYSAVFFAKDRTIGSLFERCHGAFLSRGEGIRIRLRIEPPKLASLPWELLYYQLGKCFLAVSAKTPVIRYIELMQPNLGLTAQLPLRMLVVAPQGSGLDIRTETGNLSEAIKGMEKQVTTRVLDKDVTYAAIREALHEDFHVLHFIGHGEFQNELPFLVLDDGRGGSEAVDHERFGGLFTNHDTMKLVVLNSCKGAQVSSTEPLLGMASQLVKCGVPAVIAMQYEIGDDQAILFAREFYGNLFRGPDKGQVEIAVSKARNSLLQDFPDDRVLSTPVLFSRASKGMLFELSSGNPLKDFPRGAARLDTVDAIIQTREENLRILNSEPEKTEEIRKAIREEESELKSARVRLALGITWAVLVTPLIFAVSRLAVFDRLPRWLKMESYAVWLVDGLFPKSFSDQIVMVPMTERTAGRFNRSLKDGNWRGEHAKLLEKLSLAGAKVVFFDLYFRKPKEFDDELSQAMRRARARGTSVVVGVVDAPGGDPEIAPALKGAVMRDWGLLCIGEAQDSADLVPLVVAKTGSTPEPLPSVALAAVAAYRGWTILGLDERTRSVLVKTGSGALQRVGVSSLETLRQDQKFCNVLGAGDLAANRIIDFTPSEDLRDPKRRLAYEDVLAWSATTAPDLHGKIVVVGIEVPSEKLVVLRGFIRHERYGYKLHADAINTILSGVTIRTLGVGWQFLIILILSMAGALVWVWQPDRRWVRWAALAAVILVYFAAATWAYGSYRVLLNTVYPLLALLVCYGFQRRLRRLPWRSAIWRFNRAPAATAA